MHHVPSSARVVAGAVSSLTGLTAILFAAWGSVAAPGARLWLLLGIVMLAHGGWLLSSAHPGGGRASGALLVASGLTALGILSQTLAASARAGHESGAITMAILALAVLAVGATLVTRTTPGTRARRGPMGA